MVVAVPFGRVRLFSEALADESGERLFGVADLDHSQVGPHYRDQYLLPNMSEKVVPEIVAVHVRALVLDCVF